MEIISETVIAKITIYIIFLLIQTPENMPFNSDENSNHLGHVLPNLMMPWLAAIIISQTFNNS